MRYGIQETDVAVQDGDMNGVVRINVLVALHCSSVTGINNDSGNIVFSFYGPRYARK